MFLTFQLSFLAHALIETFYIKFILSKGGVLLNNPFFGKLYCVLPSFFQYSLPIIFLISGYYLGQYWWKIVYIEKKHWRFKNKK